MVVQAVPVQQVQVKRRGTPAKSLVRQKVKTKKLIGYTHTILYPRTTRASGCSWLFNLDVGKDSVGVAMCRDRTLSRCSTTTE